MQQDLIHTCVTCKNTFSGTYCNRCGEKVLSKKELTLSYLLGQIFNEIAFWDTKFFRTLKLLLFKPGYLAKEYVNGKRKSYTKPIALFFIANLLYFFILPVDSLNSSLEIQLTAQSYSKFARNTVEKKIEKENISYDQLERQYNQKSSNNSRIFVILIAFIFSLPVSLLYLNQKRYYFEHLIFSISYISFIIYALFLLVPIVLFLVKYLGKSLFDYELIININGDVFLFFVLSLIFTYLMAGLKTFYQETTTWTLIKGILLTASSIVIIFGYRFILFLLTIIMI